LPAWRWPSGFLSQKDLGLRSSLRFCLTLYAIARGRALALALGCAALILTFAAGYQLNPRTVAARVAVWLSPWDNYVRPGGDHLAQSLWSFASGGAFGRGLGMGDAASVPAIHTDFILAAAGEELGFVGLLGIGLLYVVLIHRALRISLAAGAVTLFFWDWDSESCWASGGVDFGRNHPFVHFIRVVTPFLNYGSHRPWLTS
jgi:cell division protein FtsW (lipid II flippase)